jgi:hypothetical protein
MLTLYARLLFGLTLTGLLIACGGHSGDPPALAFSAPLNGREEVPPTASNAVGSAVVTVDLNNRTLLASVVTRGIVATDAHIHIGQPGIPGPIVFPLARAGAAVWTTSVVISDAQLATLQDGIYYVNVRSAAFPNGEIRGQIFELFPSQGQVNLMRQVAAQSAIVERQLLQLQDIIDWHNNGGFLVIGFGIGF